MRALLQFYTKKSQMVFNRIINALDINPALLSNGNYLEFGQFIRIKVVLLDRAVSLSVMLIFLKKVLIMLVSQPI
jgi:hypothetical protein